MHIETTTTKKRNGWESKSQIALPGIIEKDGAALSGEEKGKATLDITTSKASSGGISTYASVIYKTDYGFRTALSFGGTYAETGGDYGRRVRADKSVRCTEKGVRTYHEGSLAYRDAILADVAAHYGKEVADLFEAELEAA